MSSGWHSHFIWGIGAACQHTGYSTVVLQLFCLENQNIAYLSHVVPLGRPQISYVHTLRHHTLAAYNCIKTTTHCFLCTMYTFFSQCLQKSSNLITFTPQMCTSRVLYHDYFLYLYDVNAVGVNWCSFCPLSVSTLDQWFRKKVDPKPKKRLWVAVTVCAYKWSVYHYTAQHERWKKEAYLLWQMPLSQTTENQRCVQNRPGVSISLTFIHFGNVRPHFCFNLYTISKI